MVIRQLRYLIYYGTSDYAQVDFPLIMPVRVIAVTPSANRKPAVIALLVFIVSHRDHMGDYVPKVFMEH